MTPGVDLFERAEVFGRGDESAQHNVAIGDRRPGGVRSDTWCIGDGPLDVYSNRIVRSGEATENVVAEHHAHNLTVTDDGEPANGVFEKATASSIPSRFAEIGFNVIRSRRGNSRLLLPPCRLLLQAGIII